MSDIVERLRYWGADDDGWLLIDEGAAEVCLQAANEIERLNAENERLRAALRTLIASCDAGGRVEKFGVSGMTVQTNIQSSWIHNVEAWAVEEARAALAEKES